MAMVQVDVLWSYAIGAGLGVAASREAPVAPGSRWSDPNLMKTLLFLALVFAPSGLYLLWEFPSWETMHAGTRDMPAWLVCLFGVTNVTQGLLGYLVAQRLMRAGRTYPAFLQHVAGYVAMFLVLVHGWDGKGYQRFFSPTQADFLAWDGEWQAWLTSPVALTLLAMGAVLVPLLLRMQVAWLGEPGGAARLCALWLAAVFAAALAPAIACSLLLHGLGSAAGAVASVALLAGVYAPRGPVHRLHRALRLPDVGPDSPARRAAAARARPAAPAATASGEVARAAFATPRARP
jgi:hypothetical protein